MDISYKIARVVMVIVLLFAAAVTLYPLLYVFSMSISAPEHVMRRDIYFWPRGFALYGYQLVFANANVWRAFGNTIYITVIGTTINVVMTILAAYPLSRENFILKKPLTIMITITMFISGGMIPFFIVLNNLGLFNTRWAVIIPFAVSAWNILIAKAYYMTLPESLAESAKIDGANDITVLWRIMVPLSGPIIAVMTLFYAVGHWNAYFWPLVLLPNPAHQTLQLYLYRILVQLQPDMAGAGTGIQIGIVRAAQTEMFKYAAIIVSMLPIMLVYPFLQKYFVKGVMIGAVKE